MFELLAFCAGIYFFVVINKQAGEIRALEGQVRSIKEKLTPLFPERVPPGVSRPGTAQAPPEPAAPAAPQGPDRYKEPVPSGHARGPQPSASATRQAPRQAAGPPPSWRSERREPLIPRLGAQTRQEWEALVGERLLNRVGAIALIIASGLFLKYAFDREWISPALRVLIGAATGLALIVAASRQRERLPVFAQGLLGTGVSVLYLSVYASFAFYELISVPVAFALMSLVTAAAFERAVRFDSVGVGLLGWAGGYLTPLLLSHPVSGAPGADDPAALFIYLLLLQAGMIGLVAWRPDRWGVLFGLTMGGTYVTYLLWHTANYTTDSFWAAVAFLSTAWAMFLAVELRQIRNDERDDPLAGTLSWINGAVFYALLYRLVDSHDPGWMPAVTLLVAGVYAAPVLAWGKAIPPYALRSIALVAFATRLQFTGFVPPVLWAVEALIALVAGLRMRLQHLRVAGLALFGLALAGLAFTPDALVFSSLDGYSPVFNERFVAFSLIAALLAAGAVCMDRFAEDDSEEGQLFGPVASEREWAAPALHLAWATVLFGLLTVEINDFFRWRSDGRLTGSLGFMNLLSMAAVWAGYSVILVRMGVAKRSSALVQAGAGISALAGLLAVVRGAAYMPVADFQPVINFRAGVLLAVAACLYLNWRAVARSDEEWSDLGAALMGAGAAGLIFVLLTGEIRDSYRRSILRAHPSELEGLQSQLHLALSAGWLIYASVGLSLGFWLRKPGMRIAAIGLLGLTVLKVFLYDLSFLDQLYRIFSFMALGIILMAASYLYQRYRDAIFGAG